MSSLSGQSQLGATAFVIFATLSIVSLKELNTVVTEPYMDEPFHVPQVQAYCDGHWDVWDPKITTPPGLYVATLLVKSVFMVKCRLPTLRMTPMLALLLLPFAITRLTCFHRRTRLPSSSFVPALDGVVLAAFPIAWFFGMLYYTDVPGLLAVVCTVAAATQGKHWLAGALGALACTFRQTNIVWVLYAYALSTLMHLRFRRALPNQPPLPKLHDPHAQTAEPHDWVKLVKSVPAVLPGILPAFAPYALVLIGFGAFVVWNGGIVLGDKSNHVPATHVPQLFYFIAFATMAGWPALISGPGGLPRLVKEVRWRMFGTSRRTLATALLAAVMSVGVHFFTIHHPFLLADNRHYTFYVWRRVFMLHPIVPHLLVPGYIACGWAWYLRAGQDQTLLQTLLLPLAAVPVLLPTPLLEPRYFLVPYILLRAQVSDVPEWALVLEGAWYAAVNGATMYVFLYCARDEGALRFMW
ncbi:glycosyltransferase family 59 protein [Peniophora sp. CONT]|nr:glycosyltransferase family 59 protein [Peniophora sp. CONT]